MDQLKDYDARRNRVVSVGASSDCVRGRWHGVDVKDSGFKFTESTGGCAAVHTGGSYRWETRYYTWQRVFPITNGGRD